MKEKKVKLKLNGLEKLLIRRGIKKFGYIQFRFFIRKNEKLNQTEKYLIFKYISFLESEGFNLKYENC